MLKAFLCYNAFGISTTTLYNYSPSQFSVKCLTTTTTPPSNSFSPESAIKASNKVIFKTSKKSESVINFFRTHGFTDSDIQHIIQKEPWLLNCNPSKRLLPKFQFLLSKGASTSDIVRITVAGHRFMMLSLKNLENKFEFFLSKGVSSSDIVSLLIANPMILQISLEKRIIRLFELLSRFLKTNKDVIVCLIRHSKAFNFIPYHLMVANINLMTDFGVCDSNIARFLQIRPYIFGSTDLIKSLEEVKGLGFDPSRTTFGAALIAKKFLSEELWDEKVDTFKKWGWSDEDIVKAFRVKPDLLLNSVDKINLVMSFWVNEMGWNSLALTKKPHMFGYSLEKRIIPRASVLQFLLMKG
ncbi:unnamed protein product [Trifolium pratense]|nr:unnamed protein product [Trifolium pratense]